MLNKFKHAMVNEKPCAMYEVIFLPREFVLF